MKHSERTHSAYRIDFVLVLALQPQEDIFLKRRLKNYLALHEFISGPERARKFIEANLKNINPKKMNCKAQELNADERERLEELLAMGINDMRDTHIKAIKARRDYLTNAEKARFRSFQK